MLDEQVWVLHRLLVGLYWCYWYSFCLLLFVALAPLAEEAGYEDKDTVKLQGINRIGKPDNDHEVFSDKGQGRQYTSVFLGKD